VSEHVFPGLDVYLAGEHTGTLTPVEDGSYSFAYDEETVLGRAHRLSLSLSLPIRAEPFNAIASRPFFESLLPEGPVHERIATSLRLSICSSPSIPTPVSRTSSSMSVSVCAWPRLRALHLRGPSCSGSAHVRR
jgi:HipA-like protein